MGKWTRRAFIGTGVLAGGAVIFGIAIRPGNRAQKVAELVANEGETVLNVWLKIGTDNTVTAIVPHAEMGQGTHTALAMMLADELDADWDLVKVQEAPAEKEYANYALAKGFAAGEINFPAFLMGTADGVFLTLTKALNLQITGGSSSVAFTGTKGMRVAGAAARAMLVQAAAEKWGVAAEEVGAEKSILYHPASNRSAPFSEMAPLAVQLSPPAKPRLKKEEEYTIMGTSPTRLDLPPKVDGSAQFGIDVRLPNMKYATIQAPPVFGSKISSVDKSAAEQLKGIHKIIRLDDAIAVVADGYWQAKQALARVKVSYEQTDQAKLDQEAIFLQFGTAMEEAVEKEKQEKDVRKGDTDSALAEAKQIVEAEYRVPYLAHACMEPMNATAWVHDGICEVWTGSQNPLGFASDVAEALEMDQEKVKIHNQYLGGGFGRRAETDVAKQAARIAAQVDFPVQLIWSREETMQQDFYREANLSRFKAGLDANGMPVAWENQYIDKHHPPEAPHIPYHVNNQFIHYTKSKTHVPWGNWRSVDHSMHAFFTESFIDELAHAASKDPYQYRRELLAEEARYLKVLDMAAEKADWNKKLPPNWGRGIAIHKSFFTIVAEVVEIEMMGEKPRVHRVVCVADPGYAFHPDGFIAQMESGVIYGLTAALYGEISIKDGAVAQSNFHDYQMVRMDEAPKIETYIINSGNPPGGAGEPGTPPIAPALANAIFDASGKRIRALPVKLEQLV